MSLSVLSFNCALTRLKLGPLKVDLVPKVHRRARHLIEMLEQSDVDIVCLQEVYEKEHQELLRDRLSAQYPHQFFCKQGFYLYNKGLCILSKYRFKVLHELDFETVGFERISKKGAVITQLTSGIHEGLKIVNCHFPYGGFGSYSQEKTAAICMRNRDIEKLRGFLPKGKCLICGDFNFGPGIAEENYDNLSVSHQNLTSEQVTWDTKNPLNTLFPLAKPQSIDHILACEGMVNSIKVYTERILFDEPLDTPEGPQIYLSDHYGVAVYIQT